MCICVCMHSCLMVCMCMDACLCTRVFMLNCGCACTRMYAYVRRRRRRKESVGPHEHSGGGGIGRQRGAVGEFSSSAFALRSDKSATQSGEGSLSPFLFYGSMIEHQQQDQCSIQNKSNSCPEVLRLSSVTCQYPSSQMRLEPNTRYFSHCSTVTDVYLACFVDNIT